VLRPLTGNRDPTVLLPANRRHASA